MVEIVSFRLCPTLAFRSALNIGGVGSDDDCKQRSGSRSRAASALMGDGSISREPTALPSPKLDAAIAALEMMPA